MVRMFLYLPIHDNPTADGYTPPSIDVHAPALLQAIVDARRNPEPDAQQAGGGGGGGYGHNQNTPEMKVVKNFHLKKKGWIDVLAWSHGSSTKNMQDLSLTKYSDEYTPIFSGAPPARARRNSRSLLSHGDDARDPSAPLPARRRPAEGPAPQHHRVQVHQHRVRTLSAPEVLDRESHSLAKFLVALDGRQRRRDAPH